MNEGSKACLSLVATIFAIGTISGLIAFGGAVLYLGGDDSEPSGPSLTRAEVQAMIDEATFSAYDAATSYAYCVAQHIGRSLASVILKIHEPESVPDVSGLPDWDTCKEDAEYRFYNR